MSLKKVYAICLSLVLIVSLATSESKAQVNFQLKAQPGCKEIVLTWTPLEGAINYQPYIFLPSGTTYPLIDFPTNSFTFTHKELTDGKEYCYEVVAYSKDLKPIGKSNKVCAKPKCENCDIVLKYTVGKKQYFVNDSPLQMDSEPEIKNNRMFLVISFVTKHIPGTTIDWDGSAQKITITTAEGKIIKLWVGNPKAEVSGVMVDIDPAYPGQGSPYIKDSRTKVPMRFVGNHLNAKVDWDGSTSTVILSVRDTVNCGCAWTQKGRFLLQNTATKNTFKFDTNCDGVPEAIYSGDTSLININPEDGYHGKIGGYMGCVTLCVDNNTITKWKAFPNDQDCCEIPCCTFTTTNVVPPDLIRELAPGESYTYKYKFTNTCTTDHLPFVFSFSHRQNITSITPDTFTLAPGLSQTIEVKFQMPTNAKSDAEVVFSFNVNTDCGHNEQISWALHSRSTCCNFRLGNVVPPDFIRELAPGEFYTYKYSVTNTCTTDHLPIAFSFTHRENITSITPDTFTLAPGLSQTIEVKFQMPTNATTDAEVVFSFYVTPNCGLSQQILWQLHSRTTCCTFTTTNVVPPDLIRELAPGQFYTYKYKFTNTCTTDHLPFVFSFSHRQNITSITPDTFTLAPGLSQTIEVKFQMPTNAKSDAEVVFSFNVNTDCGHNEQISWALHSRSTCCNFRLGNVVPPDFIRELAPGEFYTYKYSVTNACTTDHLPIAFSFTHRENITSITPDTFTLAPGLSQTIEVKFQMPTNAKSDAEVVFSFNVNTDCGHNEQISWALHSRTTCCDWLFRMKPEQKERKLYMCPGETLSVDDYEIFNNCPIGGNALTITISWPPDKGVISVSPKSFTLQPQERMALNITIKMITSCRPDESSTFPININSKECVKKTVNIVAYCKQC